VSTPLADEHPPSSSRSAAAGTPHPAAHMLHRPSTRHTVRRPSPASAPSKHPPDYPAARQATAGARPNHPRAHSALDRSIADLQKPPRRRRAFVPPAFRIADASTTRAFRSCPRAVSHSTRRGPAGALTPSKAGYLEGERSAERQLVRGTIGDDRA